MAKKFTVDFSELEEYSRRLEQAGQDLKPVFDDALQETFRIVTPGIQNAMNGSQYNFHRTGRTAGSLISSPSVEWQGFVGSVGVGFEIENGGLASIFLMHGTPTIAPDRNLYNSVYGAKIRKEVVEKQQKVFREYLERTLSG